MSIDRLLKGSAFTPEDIQVLVTAFEQACRSLELKTGDPRREEIARKVLASAQTGERSPDQLLQAALGERSS